MLDLIFKNLSRVIEGTPLLGTFSKKKKKIEMLVAIDSRVVFCPLQM